MRNVMVLAVWVAAGFSCGICEPVAPLSQSLCVTAANGLGVEVFGGNVQYENLTCTTVRDGGVLTLTLAGTQCEETSTQPRHALGAASCGVTGVPAGTYSVVVGGSATTVTLPHQADAGTTVCPVGI